ncbi:DUF11 domain-containing protein [Hydrogenophaga palleronii]|uniref:DUF11 domain-containing protein n=1 Tax=Hydrogenophaga palleronii TaxID=65655 RepID=UPI001470C1A9|nr:DUF11 domain-containing protein [Hydrogenophaga palleronii]
MFLKSETLVRRIVGFLLLGCAMCLGVSANAQVQRSFINLGFEEPTLTTRPAQTGCFVQIPDTMVPGWRTSHPSATGPDATDTSSCANLNGLEGNLIELWRSGLLGVDSEHENNFAELNAQQASRIYQNVCMVTGERVGWSFLHRGRNSATVNDVAEFNVNSNANRVVTARTQNDGGTGYTAADCTTTAGGVSAGTCNPPALVGTWRRYSGAFTWQGSSGLHNVGFAAVSSSGGITIGNFIDDVNFTLLPYVEFSAANYTVPEQGPVAGTVQIRVLGAVPTSFVVPVAVLPGGTATQGVDFGGITNVTVPAGDYGTGRLIDVPFTITNDTVIENNETFSLSIQPSPANFVIASTQSCGGPANTTTTVTIIDNDVDLAVTKSVSTPTPSAGVPFIYTVTLRNNTAAPTVAPTSAHDAMVAVSDAVPAGLSFGSWTCTASGDATCPGGITSGTGAISGTTSLPAGSGGAAGGQLVYTITATATGSPSCGTITNTATIALAGGSPLQEGTGVQAGFVSPATGGTANNSATADVAVRCATLQLAKTWVNAALNDTAVLSGTGGTNTATLTSAANTANETDTGTAAAVLAGNTITLSEVLGAGNTALYTAGAWSCTGSAGLAGNVLTVGANDTAIVCGITNTSRSTDLQVTKTANPGGALRAGQTVVYTLTATNNGPAPAHGATLVDTPGPGLNCTASAPTCTPGGGAICPSPLTALHTGGVSITTFPVGGSVTILTQCVVN